MNVDWGQGIALMAGPWQIGHTEPSPETVGYWEGIKQGRLLIKRCTACKKYQHPRRIFCAACGTDTFDWVETKGTGTVYTFSTVHRAPSPEFNHEVPYTVGVIHLAEDVYVFSRIKAKAGGEVKIGAAVKLFFQETGPNGKLPAFQVV
ncbi:MAG: Zn-ribbon domain-containing OB-fold protein [Alphaproteobacteria bacterium]